MRRMIVDSVRQVAEIWEGDSLLKEYSVSTALKGLGFGVDSFCTPIGRHVVAEKIGDGAPVGSVFKSRLATGDVWTEQAFVNENEDLILTRILWLKGIEEVNKNSYDRYIYLHGTNHEDKLGLPASHGCIRFSNLDIIEVFNLLEVGSEVMIK